MPLSGGLLVIAAFTPAAALVRIGMPGPAGHPVR